MIQKRKMMMMDIFKPDYDKAEDLAYRVIEESNIKDLPINLKLIIKKNSNLKLKGYKKFAKELELSQEEVIKTTSSEDGCLWYYKNTDEYLLLYNDYQSNSRRIRFTIAHELGHYFLQHHKKKNIHLLTRASLNEIQDDKIEKEANFFAKRLLAPLPIIDLFLDRFQKVTTNLIRDSFDVSYTVAKYVINDLKKQSQYGHNKHPHKIKSNFEEGVHEKSHFFICSTCQSLKYSNHTTCHICGMSDFNNYLKRIEWVDSYITLVSSAIRKEVKYMIYKPIELDENFRALKCPICDNEQIETTQKHCHICDTYLSNECSGISLDNFHKSNCLYTVREVIANSCGNQLLGNARFCSCGKISTFFLEGILKDWEQENMPEVKTSKLELPF